MHQCSNMIIRCMDFRLNDTFAKANLADSFDLISLAGGAKSLVDPKTAESVLGMIRLFKEKHGGKTVYLTSHLDCGAYGGESAFPGTKEELDTITGDLKKAGVIIKQEFPELEVKLLLAKKENSEFTLNTI